MPNKNPITIELAWLNQHGRLPLKMTTVADGFRGFPAYASVAVVAECGEDDPGCALSSVAIVRDAFAEGVAYGVEGALKDAIDEVTRKNSDRHSSCSIASVAVFGEEAWVVSTGTCHVFMTDKDVERVVHIRNTSSSSADESNSNSFKTDEIRICQLALKDGQSVVLVTHGLKKLMGSTIAARYTSFCDDPLPLCLKAMVMETRIRFRKRGGSVAAVRYGSGLKKIPCILKKIIISVVLSGVILFFAISILCSNQKNGIEAADTILEHSSTLPAEDVIMPLD